MSQKELKTHIISVLPSAASLSPLAPARNHLERKEKKENLVRIFVMDRLSYFHPGSIVT